MRIINRLKNNKKDILIAGLGLTVAYLLIVRNYDILVPPKIANNAEVQNAAKALDANSLANTVAPNEGYSVDINWEVWVKIS